MKSKGCCNEAFPSETAKIRSKIQKYLTGEIIDIGCGQDIVKPGAFGIDARPFPHTSFVTHTLYGLPQMLPEKAGRADVVFSSHTLEHIPDDHLAIREWAHFLKVGGHLILYLPDTRYYDDVWNAEHIHSYIYEVFIRWFQMSFNFLRLVEHGPDVGPDRYAFYLVAQKIY